MPSWWMGLHAACAKIIYFWCPSIYIMYTITQHSTTVNKYNVKVDNKINKTKVDNKNNKTKVDSKN